jgi:hypothetical protein
MEGIIVRLSSSRGVVLNEEIGEAIPSRSVLLERLTNLLEALLHLKGDRRKFREWKETVKNTSLRAEKGIFVSSDKQHVFVHGRVSVDPTTGNMGLEASMNIFRYDFPESWRGIPLEDSLDLSYDAIFDIVEGLHRKNRKCYQTYRAQIDALYNDWNLQPRKVFSMKNIEFIKGIHPSFDPLVDIHDALVRADDHALVESFYRLGPQKVTKSTRQYMTIGTFRKCFTIMVSCIYRQEPIRWSFYVTHCLRVMTVQEFQHVAVPFYFTDLIEPYICMIMDGVTILALDHTIFQISTSSLIMDKLDVERLRDYLTRYHLAETAFGLSRKCCIRCKIVTCRLRRRLLLEPARIDIILQMFLESRSDAEIIDYMRSSTQEDIDALSLECVSPQGEMMLLSYLEI